MALTYRTGGRAFVHSLWTRISDPAESQAHSVTRERREDLIQINQLLAKTRQCNSIAILDRCILTKVLTRAENHSEASKTLTHRSGHQTGSLTSMSPYNPCSTLPCSIRCLMLPTSSLSSKRFIQAAYRGYFPFRPPDLPSSTNNPSPTKFQVTKDKSAKVHLSPTNQPVPFTSRPSSRTLITRSISFA